MPTHPSTWVHWGNDPAELLDDESRFLVEQWRKLGLPSIPLSQGKEITKLDRFLACEATEGDIALIQDFLINKLNEEADKTSDND